jgi:hypothetical protein
MSNYTFVSTGACGMCFLFLFHFFSSDELSRNGLLEVSNTHPNFPPQVEAKQ